MDWMGGMFMNTAGITAALPAQNLNRAKNFYVGKVGLECGRAEDEPVERPSARSRVASGRQRDAHGCRAVATWADTCACRCNTGCRQGTRNGQTCERLSAKPSHVALPLFRSPGAPPS